MTSTVPGNTTKAKAAVLMARNSSLTFSQAMKLAGGLIASERREQQAPQPKPTASDTADSRALNGWQPEPDYS